MRAYIRLTTNELLSISTGQGVCLIVGTKPTLVEGEHLVPVELPDVPEVAIDWPEEKPLDPALGSGTLVADAKYAHSLKLQEKEEQGQ